MRFSNIVDQIQEYPFARIGRVAQAVEQRDGIPVIRATIGNPDKEAPAALKQCIARSILEEGSTYGYPCDVYPRRGIPELVDAIIEDYRQKYSVRLTPGNIAVTSWAKEVLHNLVRMFGPGKVQIPDPVYPAYESATTLSFNVVERVKTSKATRWLPEFDLKKSDTAALYFCDPNNPTGSVADEGFYRSLAAEMKSHSVAGIFDKAYRDYVLDGTVQPVSITQVPGLRRTGSKSIPSQSTTTWLGSGWGGW